jgi:pyruvate/2-oxoacid:ferredoxin oxidoreductase beta subunit
MSSLINTDRPPVFCPGCSHERIVHTLDKALEAMGLDGSQVVIVSDIGCSGLFDTFFNTHAFHGLHGRALTYATGLKMAGDWQIVRTNCVACHSGKLITQQRGTAQQWLTMIRWMQEKQNLWQFDPVTEEKIIGYLAEYYPPGKSQRRAALPADLMPPNPYKQ